MPDDETRDPVDLVDQAYEQEEHSEWQAALDTSERAIALLEDDPEGSAELLADIYLVRGKALEGLGRIDEAKTAYRKSSRHDPDLWEAGQRLKALQRRPYASPPGPHRSSASRAATLTEKPTRSVPDDLPDPEDLMKEAYAQEARSDWQRALATCEQAVKVMEFDPEAHADLLADAHLLRGLVLEELDRFEEAKEAYRVASRHDPRLREPGRRLKTLERQHPTPPPTPEKPSAVSAPPASATPVPAPSEDSRDPLDLVDKAYEQEERGELSAALATCDQAIALLASDPLNNALLLADAHLVRGTILEELGRYEEAKQSYRESSHHDPRLNEPKRRLRALERTRRVPPPNLENQPVVVGTFSTGEMAHVYRGLLEASGIEGFVVDENTVGANWLFSNAIGGVKLMVRSRDAELALEVLGGEITDVLRGDEVEVDEEDAEDYYEEEDFEDDEEDTPACPVCGSENVRYLKYNRRGVFLSWAILQFPLPILRRQWECQNCGNRWRA